MLDNLLRRFRSEPREDLGADFDALKAHVLHRIETAVVAPSPFYHSFIEGIFPESFYDALHAHMLSFKRSDRMQERKQDNPVFVNRRYNLVKSDDLVIRQFRAVFEDPDIKMAQLLKFYVDPDASLTHRLRIHEEFEYVYCEPNRFQNIHVDIPPKFLSFVFYVPEAPVTPEQEALNATVLYDKTLKPQYAARFRKNSVCIFAPHFYSYHGFSSTMERDVLVMFYVHEREMEFWRKQRGKEEPPYTGVLDAIEGKIRRHPLIEYGLAPERLAAERAACRINAPKGRVLID